MANISKNIKKLRTAANITQQDLADRLNVTRQAVSSWENGKNQPDIQMLELLAKEFGVSLEEIIYGTQQQRNKKKLIKRAVVWGIVFVAGMIVFSILEPIIEHWTVTHYRVLPQYVLICVFRPFFYIVAGVFACTMIAVFFPIHLKDKKWRPFLIALGLIIAIIAELLSVFYFAASSIIMNLVTSVALNLTTESHAFFIIPGILLWFGLAKEPKTE